MSTETQYEQVVDGLNTLIELNYDRQNGYVKAEEDVEDADLKTLFKALSKESVGFADELAVFVRHLHGEPAESQTFSGKLHQIWLEVKTAVTDHDRKAVLKSAQFGDHSTVEAYDEVLKIEKIQMMPDVLNTLTRQREAIQTALKGVIEPLASPHSGPDEVNPMVGRTSGTF